MPATCTPAPVAASRLCAPVAAARARDARAAPRPGPSRLRARRRGPRCRRRSIPRSARWRWTGTCCDRLRELAVRRSERPRPTRSSIRSRSTCLSCSRCSSASRSLPLVVGDATPTRWRSSSTSAWGGPETLVVVSSDLSHYHSLRCGRAIDRAHGRRILALDPRLDPEEACGAAPINGLLEVARAPRA